MTKSTITFINKLSAHQIALKNIHWTSTKSKALHELTDEASDYILDRMDLVVETVSGITSRMKMGDFEPDQETLSATSTEFKDVILDVLNLIDVYRDDILKEVKKLSLPRGRNVSISVLNGLVSILDDFQSTFEKYTFLEPLH